MAMHVHTPQIPKLTESNIAQCLLENKCVENTLVVSGALNDYNHLNDNQLFNKSVSALISAIISSLPDNVAETTITPFITIDPLHIIQRVKEIMYRQFQVDHQLLEQIADRTSIVTFKDMDAYFSHQDNICTQMITDQSPRIAQEYITAKYILKMIGMDPFSNTWNNIVQHALPAQ